LLNQSTHSTYGRIPSEGYRDRYFAKRRNEQRFLPVGYGLTRVLPILTEGGDTREKALSMLLSVANLPGIAVMFSNNNGGAALASATRAGPSSTETRTESSR
jgi:hypothetical protein